MNTFHSVDWLIMGVYLTGIMVFGCRMGRGQKTTKDYFLGNKTIPWWGVGLSIVATETSALTFLGVPAIAFGGDLVFIQVIFGYVLARIFLIVFLVPVYFRKEIFSPYVLFEEAFGSGARKLVSLFFLVAGTLAAGVRVYVTCIPVQILLGFQESEIIYAILLFVLLSLIYTYIGGVKAVIWTDAIQFFLFMAAGLFTLFYIPTLIEGGWTAALSMAGEAGKLKWFDSGLTLDADWRSNMSTLFSGSINIWMGVIGATFLVLASHGTDQLIVQRVLSCGSTRDGRRALGLSAAIILPLMMVFLITGIMLWVYFQHAPGLLASVPEARPGVRKNDYVFPLFILHVMPTGFKGFLLVAILSAAMSSVSSALSALASVSTMDILGGVKRIKDWGEDKKLRLSKVSTLFWAFMLVFVAYGTQKASSVLELALGLSGLTSGAMLGGLILVLFWKRGNLMVLSISMIGSLILMIGISRSGYLAWPWYTLTGTLLTLLLATFFQWLPPKFEK